ncbi:hypothetical protein TNCV_4011581 [Trichonephila clavipes]|nr:hypothetical protein TNCV_4011581 [Trichonephila clavipes]
MKDVEDENVVDNDSEYEDEFSKIIVMYLPLEIHPSKYQKPEGHVKEKTRKTSHDEVDLLDPSTNFDEKVESLFAWNEVEGSEVINVYPFPGKFGLKVDDCIAKAENDFF